ncbi:predicted protein [Pyrenophora tritici-repentis Pt-1C-BFP]|uniref:Uncharacterized protein n=1 Tax=Pyrenophora tritici-repentis (strain Pt-1C-BFP) TaxID=426418 RepID=B2VVN8_PYRTR|nr:uncharacterized protein PTRG_01250 [Pyrenophora tritici-repentis Pt-1C-BFP]EDU40688.1 predicted protein [Pyrenophora tritici-repentis Pt-1C-BFP]
MPYMMSYYIDNTKLLLAVLENVHVGHQYDQIYRKAHPEAAIDAPLDNFTRIVPILKLKKELASRCKVPCIYPVADCERKRREKKRG